MRQEALPFLRTMFVGIVGLIMFFMLSGAFRAAGDPRTPLRLGLAMTVLTIALNVTLIPMFGTIGAAFGTVTSSTLVSAYGVWRLTRPASVIHFERGMDHGPDWTIIRSLFKFGLPTGVQGIAMNIGGVFLLRFIGSLEHSAAAQAAFAVDYTELFSLITWTSTGLLGASATIAGQNLGAGNPDRAAEGVRVASHIGLAAAAIVGAAFLLVPQYLLAAFGMTDPLVLSIGRQLLGYLARLGAVHHGCAQLHRRPAGHRRHAQSALHLDHLADCRSRSVSARCSKRRAPSRPATSGWPSCSATSRAAFSASRASGSRNGGALPSISSPRGRDAVIQNAKFKMQMPARQVAASATW